VSKFLEIIRCYITIKKIRKDGFGVLKGVTSFTIKDELTAHE